MSAPIRVTVWNEFRHEKHESEKGDLVRKAYPDGIHEAIAGFLGKESDLTVRTATLDEPEHGLTEEVLDATDVLIWWAHIAHAEVEDEIVERVRQRVLAGMGILILHSGHNSKIFKRLLGTNCSLKWREYGPGEKERLWLIEPAHPIGAGVPECLELPHVEMYGERFDIPTPDKLVFIGWFEGGEVFRSGCCWERGHGRLFYFQPGHETFPIFHDPSIQRILKNAVRWAAPRMVARTDNGPNISDPPETIHSVSLDG
jgi:trehalose utilization protein